MLPRGGTTIPIIERRWSAVASREEKNKPRIAQPAQPRLSRGEGGGEEPYFVSGGIIDET